ncbi:recombinase family protein [Curtobacterium sp. MCSS17_007]|uniref:recombinase family protein n=1 Tax=Curtobacterium sp. MCSS17_007 TaxID=2175646 RepID=UPI0015E88DA3|nr:recombinase family protein [Curtobacterium sp. MCSS17_007]WIE76549.1 recombinase family protein [Curtobacterium sp. MCSS17_007]
MRAVLYSRLSRESLVSTSLQGQGDDLRALAEREGWTVVASFVDEGLSGGKRRANADEAVRMLRDGDVDVLAAYAVDRFSRQGVGEDAELVQIVRRGRNRRTPPRVIFVREAIDSASDPSGWALRFVMASEVAHSEREAMVLRRKRSIAALQAQGRFTGRGAPPWGYRSAPFDDGRPGRRLVPDSTEAAVVREAADRLLGGESAGTIARDFLDRGVPAPRSAARLALIRGEDPTGLATGGWTSGMLSQLMQSQYLLGRIVQGTRRGEPDEQDSSDRGERLRDRYGSVVLGADGRPLQAFEPILDVDTFLRLQDRFRRGQGRGNQGRRRAARLGSGLIWCGECGHKVYVVRSGDDDYYRCSAAPRGLLPANQRHHSRVKADLAEAEMERAYLRAFGGLPAVRFEEVSRGGEADDEVADLTERMRAATSAMLAPGADVQTLASEVAALTARRDDLLALPRESRIVEVPLDGTWADVWAASTMEERRGLLAGAYDHFELRPAAETPRVVGRVRPSREELPAYYEQ